jgi:hypothetical protein
MFFSVAKESYWVAWPSGKRTKTKKYSIALRYISPKIEIDLDQTTNYFGILNIKVLQNFMWGYGKDKTKRLTIFYIKHDTI